MVLDGAIDPNADPIEEDLRQAAAFQQAFDDFAADCAKEIRTVRSVPTPPRPSTSTRAWSTRLSTSRAKTQDPRGLAYSDAIVGTILPLYSPSIWPRLTTA